MNVLKFILVSVVSFCLGALVLYFTACFFNKKLRKKAKKIITAKEKENKKKIGTLNFCLAVVCVYLITFTVSMVILFCKYGSTPDVLIGCVFGVCGTECGALAWIKNAKEKYGNKGESENDERNIQYDNETNG